MNEGQRAVLKRYHQRLAEDIIVTEDLLGELYQAGIFQKGMIELIRVERTPSERVQKLLELLPKRGPDALDLFVGVLEKSYPWLATLLASVHVKPTPVESNHRPAIAYNQQHRKPSLTPATLESVDVDIKRLVQAFVHKQFGQSKRISEKDKKNVERFVSDQIQRERTRYQSMLTSTTCSTPCSDMDSTSDNVFQTSEVQDHLFSIHLKLEPYMLDRNNNSNSLCNNAKNCVGCDSTDHHDNHHLHHHHHHPPKLMPEDMDFQLITKEVAMLIRYVELQEAKIADSLEYFDKSLQHQPLAALIDNLVRRCQAMEEELDQDRQQLTQLLNECSSYSDHIEKLEKERVEHRKQIQAAYMDMAKLRQEKAAMQDKIHRMDKERAALMAERDRIRDGYRMGIISKAAKTTPRGGGANMQSSTSSSAAANGGMGIGTNSAVMEEAGQSNSYARRAVMRGASGRATVTYTGYSKRYQAATSRYATISKKKPSSRDSATNTSTKF